MFNKNNWSMKRERETERERERETETTTNGIFYDLKFSQFMFFCVFQLSLIELENDRAVWLKPSLVKAWKTLVRDYFL